MTRLRTDGSLDPAVLEAWLDDRLSAEDAAALRAQVAQPGDWRDAYVARITELAAEVAVPRLDVTRSTSVAATDEELELARIVQDVPLPHLGVGARREGRLHASGTHWRLCDAGIARTQLLPYGTPRLEWKDDVLGTIVTELVELPLDEMALADDAMASITRLASGIDHPRAGSIALAVIHDLHEDSLRNGLQAAARAFEDAKLDAEEEQRWAACALRTRLPLQQLAHRLEDPALDAKLIAADEALRPFADAVLLLDDEVYADIVRPYELDPRAWWGIRARLDDEVPLPLVVAALDRLATTGLGKRSTVVPLAAHRATAAEETSRAHEDAGSGSRAAADSKRHPGEVDLLVTLEDGRAGRVLRVSVKAADGGAAFQDCGWFAPVARDAIRDAYAAAASICKVGAPPRFFEDHRIVVHDDNLGIATIDGSSLGLAFTLAFASLWLGKVIESNLAATGRLYWAEGAWRVGGVENIPAKAAAMRVYARTAPHILASTEHGDAIRAAGCVADEVETVAGALEAAGLDLHNADLPAMWRDEGERLDCIEALAGQIEKQDLRQFKPWGDAWRLAAERMRLLVADLPDDAGIDERRDHPIPRGKIFGALAYLHAGDPDAADRLLGDLSDGLDPRWAFVRDIIKLAGATDLEDRAETERRCALLAETFRAPPEAAKDIAGLAFGTMGRARLHAGNTDQAIPLLHRAVTEHQAHRPREVPRSRVYLASALRRAGRLNEARDQLDLATEELETLTRPKSYDYYTVCRAYLLYEQARLAIALDDPDRAAHDAAEAYAVVRHHGFWPALGILRVLAWAYRMLGDTDEADLYVELMVKLKDVPERFRKLRDRLVEEAEGRPTTTGEVY